VEQIRENPYLQFFPGLKQCENKALFHPTMSVLFRKCFPSETMTRINELITQKALEGTSDKNKKDNRNDDDASGSEPKTRTYQHRARKEFLKLSNLVMNLEKWLKAIFLSFFLPWYSLKWEHFSKDRCTRNHPAASFAPNFSWIFKYPDFFRRP